MRLDNHECYRTGDLNLFAACMSIGIPPMREQAEVIAQDDGRDYHSFRLASISECGLYRTMDMDKAWGHPKEFKAECPNHPFVILMDFISMSLGAKTVDDFICKGAEFLSIPRSAMRAALKDVPRLEVDAPDSPLSYVACFILNRFAAIKWVKAAIPKEVINQGPSILWMDGNLSKSKKKFLLGQL